MAKATEVLDKLSALLAKLNKTQKKLADLVGVSPQAVSNWMSATDESVPSAESYWRLGELAGYPDCLWFWKQAGMDINVMLPAVARLLEERGELAKSESIAVPRLVREGNEFKRVDPLWPVAARLLTNPGSGAYWLVDSRASRPIHIPGTMVILDTSAVDAGDLRALWDKVILVESTGEARSECDSALPAGVHMGRLTLIAPGHLGCYAALGPPDGPRLHWKESPPQPNLFLGQWEPSPAVDRSGLIKRAHHGGHVLDLDLVRRRAEEEMQLFRGITILGQMRDWFRPPSKGGK